MSDDKHQIGLQPHLSPMAAWALSVGTAVGWGSLVGTQYLPEQCRPSGHHHRTCGRRRSHAPDVPELFLHGQSLSPRGRHLYLHEGGLWL